MSLPQMQGPASIWALLKISLAAKSGAYNLWRMLFLTLVVAMFIVPISAQNVEKQHSQASSWGQITKEPFERVVIFRGQSALAVPLIQIRSLGNRSSIDIQVGERHTLGPDTQNYFRQITGFGNLNIRKQYQYGMVRAGYELDSTTRNSGTQINGKPFAEYWFGNWSPEHPGSTWVYVTKEQYGEGYVGRFSYTQGIKIYHNKNKMYTITIDGSVFGTYGEFSKNPWNRQIGISLGPRLHKYNLVNGEIVGIAEYVQAFRPNGQTDGIFRLQIQWWVGKNMIKW